MPKPHGLVRGEIIKKEKLIRELLENKNKFFSYPLMVKWAIEQAEETSIQTAFIVSKKRINKAFQRNLVKRRMRESYRNNKYIFQNVNQDLHLKTLFIYVSNKVEDFNTINNSMQELMQKIFFSITNENFH